MARSPISADIWIEETVDSIRDLPGGGKLAAWTQREFKALALLTEGKEFVFADELFFSRCFSENNSHPIEPVFLRHDLV